MLRPVGEPHPEGSGVSRFALLDTRGPDPLALLLSAESSTLLPQAAGPVTAKPELHGRARNAGAFDTIPTFGSANDGLGEEQACES